MLVSQLLYNAETDHFELDKEELKSGDRLKVLVFNGLSNAPEWVETSIELDDENKWYLFGLVGYALNGLFAVKG